MAAREVDSMFAEPLLVILCGLIAACLVGGLTLWGTVHLYNVAAPPSWSIPRMLFGQACEIAFVISLVALVLHEFIQALATRQARGVWELSLIPVVFLTTALMICFRLSTGLGRATVLALCYLPIAVFVGLVLVQVVAEVVRWSQILVE
jgi:hypothetical protein